MSEFLADVVSGAQVQMRKVTIRIRKDTDAAFKEMGGRFINAWKTGKSTGATLQFESPAALFRVLTPKRWELIECLQGQGPSSVRGVARVLGRDVKRVHEDVVVLMKSGLVARTEAGKIHVPYDVVHVDFDLSKAA